MKRDKIKVVVIPADSVKTMEIREIEPTLENLQAIVGGFIEVVGLAGLEASIVLNEEGKLNGLPYNDRATRMARAAGAIVTTDYIVGDVFVYGPADEDGDSTSAPDELLDIVSNTKRPTWVA